MLRSLAPFVAIALGTLALIANAAGCSSDDAVDAASESPRSVAQRVVGGENTRDYPDVGRIESGCTATLIHPQAMLTASHCCVRKGTCTAVTLDGAKREVARVIVHPEYRSDAGASGTGITPSVDVAVLWLAEAVTGVSPRVLASSRAENGKPIRFVGYGCNTYDKDAASGYGTKRTGTNVVDIVGSDADGKDTERFRDVFGWRSKPDDAGVYANDDANICPGDSGGPTFWSEGGEEVLAGIHSLVGPLFGYATMVAAVRPWIETSLPPCTTGDSEDCGECGERTCQADFTWSACGAKPTVEPRPCGASGTQACGADGRYAACIEGNPTAEPPPPDAVDSGCTATTFARVDREIHGWLALGAIGLALGVMRARRRAA